MTFFRLNTRDICIVLFSTTTETTTTTMTKATTTEQVIQDTKICEEMFPGKKEKIKDDASAGFTGKKSPAAVVFSFLIQLVQVCLGFGFSLHQFLPYCAAFYASVIPDFYIYQEISYLKLIWLFKYHYSCCMFGKFLCQFGPLLNETYPTQIFPHRGAWV